MGRISDAWKSFEAAVIPKTAGSIQRKEMRNAFFAGACAFYGELFGGLSEEEGSTEADQELLDGLRDDLVGFAESIGIGRDTWTIH